MKLPQWLIKLILRQRHGLSIHIGKMGAANVKHTMVCICGWRTYTHDSEAEAAAEFRQHAS